MLRILAILLLATSAIAEPVAVHVTVALCDNASQGIVPVPAAIGNGNDPKNNLYWGASYGVKSWLKRQHWKVETAASPSSDILERIVARKAIEGRDVVLTADAWRGSRIQSAITRFLENASGLGDGARAEVVAFVGHDGLMEFNVQPRVAAAWIKRPRSIVLACASLQYFEAHLNRAGSQPLLLTTGLMAPEAYTLTAAIEAWLGKRDVREAAAVAYDRHQGCGIRAARRLFRS
jgi:hypothetical protein